MQHNTIIFEEAGRGRAVRKGKWKYIQGSKNKKTGKSKGGQLFDLEADVVEKNNVAKDNPDVAKELSELMLKVKDTGVRDLE